MAELFEFLFGAKDASTGPNTALACDLSVAGLFAAVILLAAAAIAAPLAMVVFIPWLMWGRRPLSDKKCVLLRHADIRRRDPEN